jgi:hypothetical protein
MVTVNIDDEAFQITLILSFIALLIIIVILYWVYISTLSSSECKYMNNLYSSINGNIRPLSTTDPDCSGNLRDYYIKTAYNACSGGSYKNDFVNSCNLKALLKQGVRGIDLEIYSIDNKPVVATGVSDNYHVKDTFNSVPFSDVMTILANYAFASGTCPNPTDPLILHLRFQSSNTAMYSNIATILKSYDSIMLGKEYSFESDGKNMCAQPLLSFCNKIILVVDRSNTTFLENQDLLEYVNLTSNSVFMRALPYNDVKNTPDAEELTDYNRQCMTIVLPDNQISPDNPSGLLCRAYGCQMVAMQYQWVDNFLLENTLFFDRTGYAFALKPEALRYKEVTIPDPIPQNPDFSYKTREATTDYYSFQF